MLAKKNLPKKTVFGSSVFGSSVGKVRQAAVLLVAGRCAPRLAHMADSEAEALFARLVAAGVEPQQKQEYWTEESGWDLDLLRADSDRAASQISSSRPARSSVTRAERHIWRSCRKGDVAAVRTLADRDRHEVT